MNSTCPWQLAGHSGDSGTAAAVSWELLQMTPVLLAAGVGVAIADQGSATTLTYHWQRRLAAVADHLQTLLVVSGAGVASSDHLQALLTVSAVPFIGVHCHTRGACAFM